MDPILEIIYNPFINQTYDTRNICAESNCINPNFKKSAIHLSFYGGPIALKNCTNPGLYGLSGLIGPPFPCRSLHPTKQPTLDYILSSTQHAWFSTLPILMVSFNQLCFSLLPLSQSLYPIIRVKQGPPVLVVSHLSPNSHWPVVLCVLWCLPSGCPAYLNCLG